MIVYIFTIIAAFGIRFYGVKRRLKWHEAFIISAVTVLCCHYIVFEITQNASPFQSTCSIISALIMVIMLRYNAGETSKNGITEILVNCFYSWTGLIIISTILCLWYSGSFFAHDFKGDLTPATLGIIVASIMIQAAASVIIVFVLKKKINRYMYLLFYVISILLFLRKTTGFIPF